MVGLTYNGSIDLAGGYCFTRPLGIGFCDIFRLLPLNNRSRG
jgi:hypothetical protein